MAAFDLSRLRVPLGSLAVDGALVVSLIWQGATMTQKLEEVSRRLSSVEVQRIQPEADRRLSVIEAELVNNAHWRERVEQKIDILLVQHPDPVRYEARRK